ncbi:MULTISPECIES: hypothetical protein [Nocardia]|uniref:hypothetical protein n=1 Tax=Nocardia TaxID=1817 RepID=UPI0007A42B75|nr:MULTISPECIES: hypothetical protein [Nocardia]
MTNHLRNLGAYTKAVVAGIGTTTTAVLGLTEILPEPAKGYVVGAVAFATTVAVLLARNEAGIDQLGDDLADLLDR